jgi:hypothetical protein
MTLWAFFADIDWRVNVSITDEEAFSFDCLNWSTTQHLPYAFGHQFLRKLVYLTRSRGTLMNDVGIRVNFSVDVLFSRMNFPPNVFFYNSNRFVFIELATKNTECFLAQNFLFFTIVLCIPSDVFHQAFFIM